MFSSSLRVQYFSVSNSEIVFIMSSFTYCFAASSPCNAFMAKYFITALVLFFLAIYFSVILETLLVIFQTLKNRIISRTPQTNIIVSRRTKPAGNPGLETSPYWAKTDNGMNAKANKIKVDLFMVFIFLEV